MKDDNTVWGMDAYTFAVGRASADGRVPAHQIAGGGVRFLAGMVDLLLQTVVGALLYFTLLHSRPDVLRVFEPSPWLVPAAALELHIIYFLLLEAFSRGSTPGKALLKLRVIDLRTLAPPTPVQLLTRNLLRIVDFLPVHYLVGVASAIATPLRQRLGDRMAGTVVIYQAPLLEQLAISGVPDSVYSTSDDGYMLEAFLKRSALIEQEQATFLARDLARYLHRKYSPGDSILQRLFELEKWQDYLLELYQLEKRASVNPATDAGTDAHAE